VANLHPAIQEELDMLKERFPGKLELSLNEYAEYFDIKRDNADRHFRNVNRKSKNKIASKRIGQKYIIPILDFAYWLAQQKIVDGQALILPGYGDLKQEMKRRRGFGSAPARHDYRRLG